MSGNRHAATVVEEKESVWGQFDAAVKENGTSAKERYRKLEQKFRNGNINEQEWNEMIRLENTLKQSNVPSKRAGTDSASEYVRYKELESKFIDGNISEQEWNELLKLENVRGKFDTPDKRAGSDLKPRTEIQKGETEAWQKSLQNKENIATLQQKDFR